MLEVRPPSPTPPSAQPHSVTNLAENNFNYEPISGAEPLIITQPLGQESRMRVSSVDSEVSASGFKRTITVSDLNNAEETETLSYSNEVKKMKLSDGSSVYVKKGDPKATIIEFVHGEILRVASKALSLHPVAPNVHIVKTGAAGGEQQYSFVSEEAPGKLYREFMKTATNEQKNSVFQQYAQYYALNTVLRSEDVVGLHAENAVIDISENGQPILKIVDLGLVANRNADGRENGPVADRDSGEVIYDPWTADLGSVNLSEPKSRSKYFPNILTTRVLEQPRGRDNAAIAYQNVSFSNFKQQIANLAENWNLMSDQLDSTISSYDSLVQNEWNNTLKPVIEARINVLNSWLNGSITGDVEAELSNLFQSSTELCKSWAKESAKIPDGRVEFTVKSKNSNKTSPTGTPFVHGRDYLDNLGKSAFGKKDEKAALETALNEKRYDTADVKKITYQIFSTEDTSHSDQSRNWLISKNSVDSLPTVSKGLDANTPYDKVTLKEVNFKSFEKLGLGFTVTAYRGISFNAETGEEIRTVDARRTSGDPGNTGKSGGSWVYS